MRYLIGRLIGTGSFGRVHEAHDRAGTRYAAKVVDRGNEIGLELLRGQYRQLSAADHVGIVTVYDLVEEPGEDPCLVMEFVDGRPLVGYAREEGLDDFPWIAIQVLDALRHLHSLGGAHGDIKPDNILVTGSRGSYRAKLVDVGFDTRAGESLPMLKGTRPYMAPEVIRSEPAGGVSDLYSLGVVLYEALTGACPFSGTSTEEILERHLEFVPPPPSTVCENVDPRWDDFVTRLLSKEPMQRYRGALQAAIALGNAFSDPVRAAAELRPPRTLAHLWAAGGERVQEALSAGSGAVVIVDGRPGAGTASVLRSVAAGLRSCGARVIPVVMDEDNPVSSQVIGALAGGEAGPGSVGEGPSQAASDLKFFSLKSILEAYGLHMDRGRRHAIVAEGTSGIDAAGLESMVSLAATQDGDLDVILGLEPPADLSAGPLEENAVKRVMLAPLSKNDIEEALRLHFGVSVVPVELVDALAGNTRGSAALLEETLSEVWARRDIRYRIDRDALEMEWLNTVTLPESMRQVIEAKVRGMDETSLWVAGMIALAGGNLERKVILAAGEEPGIAPAIESLMESDVIHETGEHGMLRFNHSETRGAVRAALKPEWSQPVALRLAETMEAEGGGPEMSYRTGLLYLEGGRPDMALPRLIRAGDSLARFSIGDALLAYGRALECEPPEAERAGVEEKMGDLKVVATDLDSARELFERASSARPEARRKMGWVEALKGNYGEAEVVLAECERAARERGDEAERSRVSLDLAYVYATGGKMDEAFNLIRAAREFYEGESMPFEAGLAAYREGIVHMRSGAYTRAIALWEEGIPFFEVAGDLRLVAQSLQAIGYASRKQLDYHKAEQSLKRSLKIWSDLSGLSQRGATANTYAFVLLERGDLRHARERAEEALEFNSLAGQKTGTTLARLLIAGIDLEIGNWRRAEEQLEKAGREIPPTDLYLKAQHQRYLAVARTLAGDREGALRLAGESQATARLAGDDEGAFHALLEKAVALLRFESPAEAADAARGALVGLGGESSLLLAGRAQAVLGEALCLTGSIGEGYEKLGSALKNLGPIERSQYTGRVLMGLAGAAYLERDHDTFARHLEEAIGIFREAEARYDYAVALHLGGMEALQRGAFVRGRHYFAEAARIFSSLGIEDLHGKVVRAMEAVPSGEIETKAINSLSRISEALISNRDLDSVLNVAMDLAMDYLGADRGVLMLVTDSTNDLFTVVERKMDEESLREVIGISRSIVDSVHSTGKAVIATDLREDPRFSESKSIRTHNIMSVMCLPLTRGDSLLGLIYLDTRGTPTRFSALEKSFVDAFANQAALAIENARLLGDLRSSFEDLRTRVREKYTHKNIIGPGKRMQEVFHQANKAAPTDTSILLTGENGTGKDMLAMLIHELSPRRNGPFITVNCGTLPKNLEETQLFGIEKKVATGVDARFGFFERAEGGTIFLNEIGDLPYANQVRVLEAIDKKKFERVGGNKVVRVDVRVISATNKDLKYLMETGAFREDLYYRINHIQIHLPSLRDRTEDLPELIAHFIREYAAKNRKSVKGVSREAMGILKRYSWPGNVRELERCIERTVVFAESDEIRPEDISEEILQAVEASGPGMRARSPGQTLPVQVAAFERLLIEEAMREEGGVKSRAARRLGIHEATIRKKLRDYGIGKSPE